MSDETSGAVEDEELIWTLAQSLRRIMDNSLGELNVQARLSMAVILDAIRRWRRDVRRLEEGQPKGVHPVKYIAYQVFWIRKLKPASDAYRLADLTQDPPIEPRLLATKEVIDINERLAIHVAVKLLREWTASGKYPTPQNGDAAKNTSLETETLDHHLEAFLRFPDQTERRGSTYDNLIYNQRFRTFGPHHLAHILDQAVFGALREQTFKK